MADLSFEAQALELLRSINNSLLRIADRLDQDDESRDEPEEQDGTFSPSTRKLLDETEPIEYEFEAVITKGEGLSEEELRAREEEFGDKLDNQHMKGPGLPDAK